MDAQKKIRKYICKKAWVLWTGLALLCAAVAVFIGGIAAFFRADTTVTPYSREASQPGTMASLEITGVSHWLYRTTDTVYYTATDAQGNSYTISLTDAQFGELGSQALYYITQTGDVPAAVSLTGCVQTLPEEVRAGLADIWDVSEEEFDSIFGGLVLNCTTTSRRQAAAPFISPAAFLALIGLAVTAWYLHTALTARRCLARLAELGLTGEAAAQLADLDRCKLLGDDRGKLTKDFLFGRKTGMALFRGDIVWLYRTEKSRLFLLPRTVLMAGTLHTGLRTAVNMGRFDRLGVTSDVIQEIAKTNPKTRQGKTKENTAAFRKLRKK